ncbi:Protein of unknown function [Malonomonas rubra DSM 5091]|uniref:DUF3144 domain-containing protein n=1 Tax=Malonomonas rubra DSM 5091 TaxID=1122189 RepID=A0A1M6JE50_MALRU|nr:DUF3144 domain-containing protein [Malonomonas rubra]SHJ44987.1 Protein of unknown function [Malonomonas rubra DSM 5091]
MSEKITEKELFDMADKFISVANQLVQNNDQNLPKVGAAFRYAAARFSAHEASLSTANLAEERVNALAWFTEQYNTMLQKNLDQYVALQQKENK